jgi:hypothetical protein
MHNGVVMTNPWASLNRRLHEDGLFNRVQLILRGRENDLTRTGERSYADGGTIKSKSKIKIMNEIKSKSKSKIMT